MSVPISPFVSEVARGLTGFASGRTVKDAAELLTGPLPLDGFDEDAYDVARLVAARALIPEGHTGADLLQTFEYLDPFPEVSLERINQLEEELGGGLLTDGAMPELIERLRDAFGEGDPNLTSLLDQANDAVTAVEAHALCETALHFVRYRKFAPADADEGPKELLAQHRAPEPFLPRADDLAEVLRLAGAGDRGREILQALVRDMSGESPSTAFCVQGFQQPIVIWAGSPYTATGFLAAREILQERARAYRSEHEQELRQLDLAEVPGVQLVAAYGLLAHLELVPRVPPTTLVNALAKLPQDDLMATRGPFVHNAMVLLQRASPEVYTSMCALHATEFGRRRGEILIRAAGFEPLFGDHDAFFLRWTSRSEHLHEYDHASGALLLSEQPDTDAMRVAELMEAIRTGLVLDAYGVRWAPDDLSCLLIITTKEADSVQRFACGLAREIYGEDAPPEFVVLSPDDPRLA